MGARCRQLVHQGDLSGGAAGYLGDRAEAMLPVACRQQRHALFSVAPSIGVGTVTMNPLGRPT